MPRSLTSLAVVLLATAAAFAAPGHGTAPKPNPAFEALKGLEGTWTGKAGPAGGETANTTVIYKVTGAGSALEERLFPGTAHEMVTMYHLDGDAVVLTHYCAAGNQPRMKLASSDGRTFAFTFAGGTNIKDGDTHMHEAKITLVGDGKLKSEWTSWSGGKADPAMVFELTRSK